MKMLFILTTHDGETIYNAMRLDSVRGRQVKWKTERSHKRRTDKMDKPELIKNISFSEAHVLRDLVDYQKGRVVSRTLAQNDALSLTLFAFDQGEGLSTHAAPGDAMVQVLDGEVSLTIGGKEVTAKSGEVVVMPADVPHSVNAVKPFKMLLTVVKKPKAKQAINTQIHKSS